MTSPAGSVGGVSVTSDASSAATSTTASRGYDIAQHERYSADGGFESPQWQVEALGDDSYDVGEFTVTYAHLAPRPRPSATGTSGAIQERRAVGDLSSSRLPYGHSVLWARGPAALAHLAGTCHDRHAHGRRVGSMRRVGHDVDTRRTGRQARVTAVAAGGLLVTLLAPGATAADARSADQLLDLPLSERASASSEARAGAPVVARTGALTERPTWVSPAATDAARQLASASVRQDLDTGRVSGTFVLRAAPGAVSELVVTFGFTREGICRGHTELATSTTTPAAGFSRSGTRVTLDREVYGAGFQDWDCAFAALVVPGDRGASVPYDVLGGDLVDVLARPVLKIGSVRLLDKDAKRLRLVRNVWTPLTVTVENPGRVDVESARIVSGSRAFKVRGQKVGKVYDGGSAAARIEVKLVSAKKRTTLRLVAQGDGAKAAATRAVTRVAPPKRPVAGTYRSKDGAFSFRIARGKVTGFRARSVRMVCRPPLDFATYRTVTLTYPKKVTVARNGIVDAQLRWEGRGEAWYVANLRMKVTGTKVARAHYSYTTAGYCSVSKGFTVKRR